MHTESTLKTNHLNNLKTDPFAVCVELQVFNIIRHEVFSDTIKIQIAKSKKTIDSFVANTDVYFAIAKVIDSLNMGISEYFNHTHPGNYVISPKYFLCKKTFAVLKNNLCIKRDELFKDKIIHSVNFIIQKSVSLKYKSTLEYWQNEVMLACNIPPRFVSDCLANNILIYIIDIISREFKPHSAFIQTTIEFYFNTPKYSKLLKSTYNNINTKFGSVKNLIKLIDSEINKKLKV